MAATVQLRPKNTFHCEIFTQKFVRMVFALYLRTALRREGGSGRISQQIGGIMSVHVACVAML